MPFTPATYSVVWFKRDLRIEDHEALARAVESGPVLCLYIIEPSIWRGPDMSTQHYHFLLECLRDLHRALRAHGGQLHVECGEAVDVLARLHAAQPFSAIYSHEETGNDLTYARDRQVKAWCRRQDVDWHEYRQFGVVRRLKHRDVWKDAWETHMATPQQHWIEASFVSMPWPPSKAPAADALGLQMPDMPARQTGGRAIGLQVWNDFLQDRSQSYRGGISSPLSAPSACSRISPYLTYGCISMREVVQATRQKMDAIGPSMKRQHAGLAAFQSRLYWHCHFIQKLESQPDMEFHNLHRGYDGLREVEWEQAKFAALVQGRTGWPMVDACVAMLNHTGWLNFRMRAMLVSVAAYPLWLHWREVGHWLARLFLDYEPGIHWSQLQMQSGTTGINATRVYNPIKQARDHDPNGNFVRQWLPWMRKVPDTWLFEPWKMPEDLKTKLRIGKDEIPTPLVDIEQATREGKAKLYAVRTRPDVRAGKTAIVEKHASRSAPRALSRAHGAPRSKEKAPANQLSLELEYQGIKP